MKELRGPGTMAALAHYMSLVLGVPVGDGTGIAASYRAEKATEN